MWSEEKQHHGGTKEAGNILHLDLQLFFMWQVEECFAMGYHILYQIVADSNVFDIEKADLEERIAKRGEKDWF